MNRPPSAAVPPRRTPRLAALLLALAPAAAPQAGTVEKSDVLLPSPALFAGLAPGDGLGRAIAVLGDLDGNGTTDLALGAPGDDGAGEDAGAVWIVFRAPGGGLLSARRIGEGAGGFGGDLDPGDHFGESVAALGDLDGDGRPELAIGAPGDDDGGSILFPDPQTGAVWIVSLEPDGSVARTVKLANGSGGLSREINELDRFGRSVARLSDLDGDGLPELAVGAPGDDGNGIDAGAVWIVHLAADGTAAGEQVIPLGATTTRAGEALACVGDVDGNGTDDLAVGGLWFQGVSQQTTGFVLLLLLEPGGAVKQVVEIEPPPGAGDGYGSALAPLGDLDGDGVLDLAVGGPLGDLGGEDRGQVWVALLGRDGQARAFVQLGHGQGGMDAPLHDGDLFGWALASLGDEDGDGTVDLLAGAPGADGAGRELGALWRLFLDDGRWVDVGGGLSGTAGVPTLDGDGALLVRADTMLQLETAAPHAPVLLVVGGSELWLPLLGGTLVPAPDLLLPAGHTTRAGTLRLVAPWPVGVPPGASVWFQAWIVDPAGPAGWSASNGLRAHTP